MTTQRLARIYHPYWDWEEMDSGMWGGSENEKAMLERAITFTGDHKVYGRFMARVISEWVISCENSLTNYSINRKAWLGHAACAMAIGCPEHITRKAWGFLDGNQQMLANREADRRIVIWEKCHRENIGVREYMDKQML